MYRQVQLPCLHIRINPRLANAWVDGLLGSGEWPLQPLVQILTQSLRRMIRELKLLWRLSMRNRWEPKKRTRSRKVQLLIDHQHILSLPTSIAVCYRNHCLMSCTAATMVTSLDYSISHILKNDQSLTCDAYHFAFFKHKSNITEFNRLKSCEIPLSSLSTQFDLHIRRLKRGWSSALDASWPMKSSPLIIHPSPFID